MKVISIALPRTWETDQVGALLKDLEARGAALGEPYLEAARLDHGRLFGGEAPDEYCDRHNGNAIRWNPERLIWEQSASSWPWSPCFRAVVLGLSEESAVEVWQLYFLNMMANTVPNGCCLSFEATKHEPIYHAAYEHLKIAAGA